MIRCLGQVREGADGRYYVTVRGAEGSMNPFYIADISPPTFHGGSPIATPEQATQCRSFVDNWIIKNCAGEAEIFGNTSVVFEDQGDAGLFWMTFTKKAVDE